MQAPQGPRKKESIGHKAWPVVDVPGRVPELANRAPLFQPPAPRRQKHGNGGRRHRAPARSDS
jgi:hypothetical protein